MNSIYKPFIFIFVLIFLSICLFPSCNSLNVHPGAKWPNGVVKYKFHEDLTLKEISEVKKAFNDYHTKTCIKFLPLQEGDVDFVSIEMNTQAHGSGLTCKVGGSQHAKIGQTSNKLAYIVELLGFALCLNHEHKRVDRDNYLSYQEVCNERPKISDSHVPIGIYDYESQWHWSCNKCETGWPKMPNATKCGQSEISGLSVLDADGINALYNCQGCHRHRWRPVENLTIDDKASMQNFGFESRDGTPLYPCRARIRAGSVIAGKYDETKKSCQISEDLEHYEVTKNVEVLTIPGGLSKGCGNYKLVDKVEASLANIVAAGAWNTNNDWKSYVVYASVNGTDGKIQNSVGNVWIKNGAKSFERSAEVAVGNAGVNAKEYKVLTCSMDTNCMLEELYINRKSCN